jgi:hypothetical protein
MKTLVTFTIAFALLLTLTTAFLRPVAAEAASAEPSLRVLAVSTAAAGTGWNVTLSNGVTLFVEVRVFETGGQAPIPGAITAFTEQHYLPVFGFFGYASFHQGRATYYGYRT